MKRYINYFKYIVRHKWYVYKELKKHKMYWQAIIHDLSKFLPSEFGPYARYFYDEDGVLKVKTPDLGYYKPQETGDKRFEFAISLHYKRNPHHWEYWTTPQKYLGLKLFVMPEKYMIEAICDWIGAAKAQGIEKPDTIQWYKANRNRMQLHDRTARRLAELLTIICKRG